MAIGIDNHPTQRLGDFTGEESDSTSLEALRDMLDVVVDELEALGSPMARLYAKRPGRRIDAMERGQ
ncbi:MAG: hypothetical protein O7C75_21395 [Verrucomicrobia bacterium]|nr:hypothetical protein [Verrucomicrobiota bacterium]